jgi:hypothetical protein
VGLAFGLEESAARMKAGDNNKTARAEKRNMKVSSNIQHRGLGNKPVSALQKDAVFLML